jgi:hypothetical protein
LKLSAQCKIDDRDRAVVLYCTELRVSRADDAASVAALELRCDLAVRLPSDVRYDAQQRERKARQAAVAERPKICALCHARAEPGDEAVATFSSVARRHVIFGLQTIIGPEAAGAAYVRGDPVPAAVRAMYPDMAPAEYGRRHGDTTWWAETVDLCDACTGSLQQEIEGAVVARDGSVRRGAVRPQPRHSPTPAPSSKQHAATPAAVHCAVCREHAAEAQAFPRGAVIERLSAVSGSDATTALQVLHPELSTTTAAEALRDASWLAADVAVCAACAEGLAAV